jgi:D-alanyl-lipoteichoic acid acyltransferase DltB (MBOAT superfamily)
VTTVVDPPFLLVAAVTVLAARASRMSARRVEVLAAASLLFVASATQSLGDAACLLVMAATGWLLVQVVSRRKSGILLAFGIGCVVTEFLLSRQVLPDVTAPSWLSVGRTIGLSYVMFRLVHLVVDAHGDELPPRTRLRDYICYLFCYLTFLAGPIQRFQEFADDAARPVRGTLRDAAAIGAPAIVTGYLKFTVIAAAFFACFTWSQDAVAAASAPAAHAIGWLSFAGYLYASFSGYTDIVRGLGKLIGFELPANFDRPFAAANFLDFLLRLPAPPLLYQFF